VTYSSIVKNHRAAVFRLVEHRDCCDERLEQDAQKTGQPAQEEAEVVASGDEYGIDAVALASLEIIAAFSS
jgi:hypothetical protein